MSILDTFYILFKSNMGEVEQAEKSATGSAEKLGATLVETGDKGEHAAHKIAEENGRLAESFDHVKEAASEWAERLVEHAFEVAAAFQALFAVEKLVDSVFETAEQSDQLGERAKSIGVNVEVLDAWGNATKRVGGSAEAFGESILHVNTQMERMATTGKSRILPFFKALGVEAIDPVTHKAKALFDLLPQLAKATEGKSKQETTGALRGIGFDEGTIRLLQRGGKEVEEMIARQKRLGLVTAEDAETAEKFNIEWMDVKQLFHEMMVEFDTLVLPTLEGLLDIIESITEFLGAHKQLVVGFFIALAAGVLYAAEAFGILNKAMIFFTGPIFAIIVGITALIALFAFAYDDLMNFAEGNKSVIGELEKRWPVVGDIARGVIAAFKWMRTEAVAAITEMVAWFGRIPEGLRQWEDIFAQVGVFIANFVRQFVQDFKNLDPAIAAILDDIGSLFSVSGPLWAATFHAFVNGVIASFRALWAFIEATFNLFANLIVNPKHAFQIFSDDIKSLVTRMIGDFGGLGHAFDAVGVAFAATGAAIMKLWHDIAGTVTGAIDTVTGAIGKVTGFAGRAWSTVKDAVSTGSARQADLPSWLGGSPGAATTATPSGASLPDVGRAQAALASTNSPLMAQTPASLAAANQNTSISNTVTVQGSTINAQTNTPDAVKAAVDQSIGQHVNEAVTHLSSGVSH